MIRHISVKGYILDLLEYGPKGSTEISRTLGVSPPTVMQHLKELKDRGIVGEFQDQYSGSAKYFKVKRPMASPMAVRIGGGRIALHY